MPRQYHRYGPELTPSQYLTSSVTVDTMRDVPDAPIIVIQVKPSWLWDADELGSWDDDDDEGFDGVAA